MQGLAGELGVDRSTLFRWVGNRDTLLLRVLTALTDPALRDAAERAPGDGGARIARIASMYAARVIAKSYFRDFLRREPERALRIMTTNASPLQRHVVEVFDGFIRQEEDRGFTHALSSRDLAYLIVRIIESFIYADLIIGDEPNADKVEQAIAALVHASLSDDGG